MNDSINNTLLALLLSVRNLPTPLTSAEEESLSTIANQLSLSPQMWEVIIEPELMEFVAANPTLNNLFHLTKSQLEKMGNISPDLLPTTADIEAIIPTNNQPKTRPIPNINPNDLKSNEITNMAIRVMSISDTSTTVKELNHLEQLWQMMNQSVDLPK